MAFEAELAAYEKNKERLVQEAEGQFVAILGDSIIGPYLAYADAYAQGATLFSGRPFLIKQVFRQEPVTFTPGVGAVQTDLDKVWQYSTQPR